MKSAFQDKVVVITGASSGIGRETALAFARANARVVLAARKLDRLQEFIATHPQWRDRLRAAPTDVTRDDDVQRLFARTVTEFGGVDILVNNAGIGLRASIAATREADARRLMEVNFFGPLRCIQAALPLLKRRPADARGIRGQVVNLGSILSMLATPYNGLYSASKFALRALSDSLRFELQEEGIEVILIMPGYTDTPFFDNMIRYDGPPRVSALKGQHPAQVARAILRACTRHQHEVALSAPGKCGVWLKRFAPRLLNLGLARTRHNP